MYVQNIRRRVYDALNVLMAMGIISKGKKEIKWLGLPTNAKADIEALHVSTTGHFLLCMNYSLYI